MHEVVRMPDPKLEELFLLTAEQMAMPPGRRRGAIRGIIRSRRFTEYYRVALHSIYP